MLHLGDICKLNGAELPPVEVICFGAPCQDLSQAGARRGIRHEELGDGETTRSGLFVEAVRIIKEMRSVERRIDGTNDLVRYPRICIYENVYGMFSAGDSFRLVLELLAGIGEDGVAIPRPKRWTPAGCIQGNGFSLAWRTMDARFWGVPQRRKRVCVLLSLDECGRSALQTDSDKAEVGADIPRAAAILFEREGRSGDSQSCGQSFIPWEGIASPPTEGAELGNSALCYGWDGGAVRDLGIAFYEDCSKTVTNGSCPGFRNHILIADEVCSLTEKQNTAYTAEDEAHTLRSRDYKDPQIVALSEKRFFEWHEDEEAVTLRNKSGSYGGGSEVLIVSRSAERSATPTTEAARMIYAIENHPQDGRLKIDAAEQSQTLSSWSGTGGNNTPMVMAVEETHYIVRRLTPWECCRLQGYPTDYLDLPEKAEMTDEEFEEWQEIRRVRTEMDGKKYHPAKDKATMLKWYNKMITADSHRYMALGNSIAIPQWYWILWKCMPYLKEKTLGSLFDGIGGFPLAFEKLGGTAVWASEIEPYPIAVTKYHFPNNEDKENA